MTDCNNRKDGNCCGKPKDPKECSDEQIRKCHGESQSHSCEEKGCCDTKENDK